LAPAKEEIIKAFRTRVVNLATLEKRSARKRASAAVQIGYLKKAWKRAKRGDLHRICLARKRGIMRVEGRKLPD